MESTDESRADVVRTFARECKAAKAESLTVERVHLLSGCDIFDFLTLARSALIIPRAN